MNNYESHDLLRSNQQEKENEATSVRAGTKKSHQKTKSKTKKNKKGFSITKKNKKTRETEETEPDSTSGNTARNVSREVTTNERVLELEPDNNTEENEEPDNSNKYDQVINN
jgi:hypothetical protein